MIRHRSVERSVRDLVTMTVDAAIAMLVLYCTVTVRRNYHVPGTKDLLAPEKFLLDPLNFFAAAATLVVALALSGFYNARITSRHRPLIGAALLIRIALLTLVATLLQRPYPRTILFAGPLIEAPLLLLWRRLLTGSVPPEARDTVLVGRTGDVSTFLSALINERNLPISVSGFVSTGGDPEPAGISVPSLGTLDDGTALARLRAADEVICLSADAAVRLKLFEIRGPIGYLVLPHTSDALLGSATLGQVGDQPLVEVAARAAFGAGALLKRAVDIILAAVLIVVTVPLQAIIALTILIDSGRPVLVWQRRAGRMGHPFRMPKFRTLITTDATQRALVRENDERVTRTGSWLRRYRLDELPQLYSVLAGTMSIVGPRPEQTENHEQLTASVPGFGLRLLIRPGITGLAQVSSEYETDPATKLRYDLTYMCAWSLWLDLRLVLQSVSTALAGRGL